MAEDDLHELVRAIVAGVVFGIGRRPKLAASESFSGVTTFQPTRPFWQVPKDGGWRQNTDPLVFGDHFLYSNCRQRQNGKMRDLAHGSLVLFGSKLGGQFVLDTLFVVDGSAAEQTVGKRGCLTEASSHGHRRGQLLGRPKRSGSQVAGLT